MNPPVKPWYLMTSHSWKSSVTPGFFFQPGVTLDSFKGGAKIWQIYDSFLKFLLKWSLYELFYLICMLFHRSTLSLVHFIFSYILFLLRDCPKSPCLWTTIAILAVQSHPEDFASKKNVLENDMTEIWLFYFLIALYWY